MICPLVRQHRSSYHIRVDFRVTAGCSTGTQISIIRIARRYLGFEGVVGQWLQGRISIDPENKHGGTIWIGLKLNKVCTRFFAFRLFLRSPVYSMHSHGLGCAVRLAGKVRSRSQKHSRRRVEGRRNTAHAASGFRNSDRRRQSSQVGDPRAKRRLVSHMRLHQTIQTRR
jgi:hypothetical protein